MTKISILGCGWVGKAFLEAYNETFEIAASLHSQSSFDTLNFSKKYLLNESNNYFHADFFACDVLIISISPRKRYFETIETVLNYIKEDTTVILLSSTSVYKGIQGDVNETSTKLIKNPSILLKTELFLAKNHPKSNILRLGGLMGYDRISGKYSQGTTLEHDALANYVHRDDVIAILHKIISHNIYGETFNVVAPLHPKKSDIFAKNEQQFFYKRTSFKSYELKGHVVSSKKLQKMMNYQFLKPDPLHFW